MAHIEIRCCPKACVFISYRRKTGQVYVELLYNQLSLSLKKRALFLDTKNVSVGGNFWAEVGAAIAACKIMLVIIDPEWASVADEQGRRLFNLDDYVRREIEMALQLNKCVIPVLVGGAKIPKSRDLPVNLANLLECNAVEIENDHFELHVEALVDELRNKARLRLFLCRWCRWICSVFWLIVLLIVAFLIFYPDDPSPPPQVTTSPIVTQTAESGGAMPVTPPTFTFTPTDAPTDTSTFTPTSTDTPSITPTLTDTPTMTATEEACADAFRTGTEPVANTFVVPAGGIMYISAYIFDDIEGGVLVTITGPYEGLHIVQNGIWCKWVTRDGPADAAQRQFMLEACTKEGDCSYILDLP